MSRKELNQAMEKAEKKFYQALSQEGYEPGYFDIELIGYMLQDVGGKPIKKTRFQADHKVDLENQTETESGEKTNLDAY